MRAFEIEQEYHQILAELYDEDGIENPQALAKLEENNNTLQNKAISLSKWIKNLEIEKASVAAAKKTIDEAKKNMIDREKALENKINRWEGWIHDRMNERGITEISCPYFVIKVMKKAPSLDVIDEGKIDDDYFKITKTLDRVTLLQHLKGGMVCNGAHIKTGTRLSIK